MDSRKKILIVDDEQINLEFFDVMLSKLGFIVEKAENGVEALEQVKHFGPDLIILDNIMPRMSGWEVTKTLKNTEEYREYREVPIIMFSAMDDVKDKVEGFELGVDDYITKPYNFSEVLARIRAVLRNRELFAQIAARESRLAIEEQLNKEIQDLVFAFDEGMSEVEQLALQTKSQEAEQLKNLVLDKVQRARTRIKDLEERIQTASSERERIKQREIELKTLEHQFRKGLQQQ